MIEKVVNTLGEEGNTPLAAGNRPSHPQAGDGTQNQTNI